MFRESDDLRSADVFILSARRIFNERIKEE